MAKYVAIDAWNILQLKSLINNIEVERFKESLRDEI